MMRLMTDYYENCTEALKRGADVEKLVALPVREQIGRFKYYSEDDIQGEYNRIAGVLTSEITEAIAEEAE